MNSITEGNQKTGGPSVIMWTVMGIGVVAIAALVIWLAISPTPERRTTPQLQGGLREGAQFEELKKKIVLDPERDFTTESRSMMGGVQMNLVAVVRNFTGKTLTGLELVGSVVDKDGKVLKEKTITPIPAERSRLDANKTMPVTVVIDGFEESDDRSDFRWRISALKVE